MTSTPLTYGAVVAAIAIGCVRELWTAGRGSRPIALTALSAVLAIVAFAVVLLRLATLAQ